MRKKILVVDNNPVILKLMTSLLEQEGHEVKTASDGLSALYLLEQFLPDVIFTDLVMPNISGEKLCRIIRDMPQFSCTSLVILSAIAAEEKVNWREYGADACIAKGADSSIKKHVLELLRDSEKLKKKKCYEDDLTIGLENIHTREVTKELLSSKKHFEAIIQNMNDGVLELTAEGKIICANQTAVHLAGIKEEKLLASDFLDLFSTDSRKQLSKTLVRARDAAQSFGDHAPPVLNGNYITLHFQPVPNEADTSIIVMIHDVTKRVLDETALTVSETRYRELFDHMLNGVSVYESPNNGKDFFFVDFNEAAERIENISREEVLGKNVKDVFPNIDQFGLLKVLRRVWQTGIAQEHPLSFYRDERIVGWRENYVYRLPSAEVVTIFRDVTGQKQAEENLAFESGVNAAIAKLSQMLISADSSAALSSVLLEQAMELTKSSSGFVGYVDEKSRFHVMAAQRLESGETDQQSFVLEKLEGLLGRTLATQKSLLTNTPPDDPEYSGMSQGRIPIQRFLAAPALLGNTLIGEVALGNSSRNYTERDKAIAEQLASLYALAVEKQRNEEQITHLAHHDPLTGLVNRRLLPDRIDQALRLARRNRQQVALFYLDLDNFKDINDTFGHRVGDEVLRKIAKRFTETLRASDTVARLGGDEFAITLQGIKEREDAATVARKIIKLLNEPLDIEGKKQIVKASIGISLFPGDGASADLLLQKADEAMYRVKQQGGDTFGFSSP